MADAFSNNGEKGELSFIGRQFDQAHDKDDGDRDDVER